MSDGALSGSGVGVGSGSAQGEHGGLADDSVPTAAEMGSYVTGAVAAAAAALAAERAMAEAAEEAGKRLRFDTQQPQRDEEPSAAAAAAVAAAAAAAGVGVGGDDRASAEDSDLVEQIDLGLDPTSDDATASSAATELQMLEAVSLRAPRGAVVRSASRGRGRGPGTVDAASAAAVLVSLAGREGVTDTAGAVASALHTPPPSPPPQQQPQQSPAAPTLSLLSGATLGSLQSLLQSDQQ